MIRASERIEWEKELVQEYDHDQEQDFLTPGAAERY
jgi:hypothetical protein